MLPYQVVHRGGHLHEGVDAAVMIVVVSMVAATCTVMRLVTER